MFIMITVLTCIYVCVYKIRASLVAQLVKNLSAMQGTLVQFLGRENSPGKGNGYPFQYSCLENPMDRAAWQATAHGVPESDTTEVA